FFGLKTVCVGSDASVIIMALCVPVPPFSMTLEFTSSANDGLAQARKHNRNRYLIFFIFLHSHTLSDLQSGKNGHDALKTAKYYSNDLHLSPAIHEAPYDPS